MRILLLIFLLSVPFSWSYSVTDVKNDCAPRHLRLSLGYSQTEIQFHWEDFCEEETGTYVKINNQTAKGFSYLFTDDDQIKTPVTVHRAFVSNLTSNTVYQYQVGSDEGGWSNIHQFKTLPATTPLRVSVWGDMGIINQRILPQLLNHSFDFAIHAGDFAYNLNYYNGYFANKFFEMISLYYPLTSENIFETCPGNHESHNDFSYYRWRLSSRLSTPMYYSFNVANVHFVSINSEYYFSGTSAERERQYQWLESDLRQVNRTNYPWIIVYGHRQMYASGCVGRNLESKILRDGLEDLLMKYHVDLYLCGHQHYYERMFPVYKEKFEKMADNNSYVNPKYPVHIVNGAAGCHEMLTPFNYGIKNYSAVRIAHYSFGIMTFFNETHLEWEQFNSHGEKIDKLTIISGVLPPTYQHDSLLH